MEFFFTDHDPFFTAFVPGSPENQAGQIGKKAEKVRAGACWESVHLASGDEHLARDMNHRFGRQGWTWEKYGDFATHQGGSKRINHELGIQPATTDHE